MKNQNQLQYSELGAAELHNPSCGEVFKLCCSRFRFCGVFLSVCILCLCFAGLGVIASLAIPPLQFKLLAVYLIGAGGPFITLSVYASEIFGGKSVDKGQTFLVIVVHTCFFFLVLRGLLIPYIREPISEQLKHLDSSNPYCAFQEKVKIANTTTSNFSNLELTTPCYGMGLAVGLGGAVWEEIIKIATIAIFMRHGWIADPFAVLVYSFVIGSTFGFIENRNYVPDAFLTGRDNARREVSDDSDVIPNVAAAIAVALRTLIAQVFLHPTCTMISGMLLSQRKFLFWKSSGEISCYECTGPRPTWLIVIPAIFFHFVHNFLAGSMPADGLMVPVYRVALPTNFICMLIYALYLFLTLQNVPRVNVIDLAIKGEIPSALSYILCCGCCRRNTARDRRYESVLSMIEVGSGKGDGEYLPPKIEYG